MIYEVGIAGELAEERGIDILQAPARHHGIIAHDKKTGGDSQETHILPGVAAGEQGVGTVGVGRTVTADDKLGEHTGDAQHKHTEDIDQNEGCAAILARHIGKSPHIAQSDGTAGGGKYHSQFGSEITSIFHHFPSNNYYFYVVRTNNRRD